MNYLIKTYGCQMNVHESEKLSGMLESLNFTCTDNESDADIIVFNTCCIRNSAEQKISAHIGAVKNLKKKNKNLIVAICGCMAQENGKPDELIKKFPFINIIFGTHNLHLFKEYLLNFLKNKKKLVNIWEKEQGIFENVEMTRTSGSNAWVNISYGCNNFCTYCIVPYVRGRERSRNFDDIISEVKSLVKDGYKTITLLGQNVNSYGNDIDDEKVNFSNLLEQCAKIDGDFKIKFMTSHPKDLSEQVVKTIAKYNKLAKVIHLPVQSGSNSILKAMNRCYTREKYLSLINMIRKYIPDCYISTDIIVGFPGETEQDFLDTLDLVKTVQFDGVFGFMYSIRTGTVAEKLENQIPVNIKKERVNKLLNLSKDIIKKNNLGLLNKNVSVLIIESNSNSSIGVSDSGKTINIVNPNLNLNSFYDIKITKVQNNKIIGEIL